MVPIFWYICNLRHRLLEPIVDDRISVLDELSNYEFAAVIILYRLLRVSKKSMFFLFQR